MPSRDSLEVRRLSSRGVVKQVTGADTSVAFTLDYIGTGTITSVIVDTDVDIEMITSDGGTDTYIFDTYNTLGELVDKINSDGIFQARIVDGLRSQTTESSEFVDGTLAAGADGKYSIMWDTSVALHMSVRLSYNEDNSKLRDSHRVALKEIVTSLTLGGGADTAAMKIYETSPRGLTETLLIARTPTSGSVVTLNWASGEGAITAANGNDLVVVVTDGTSFAAGDYITIAGVLE